MSRHYHFSKGALKMTNIKDNTAMFQRRHYRFLVEVLATFSLPYVKSLSTMESEILDRLVSHFEDALQKDNDNFNVSFFSKAYLDRKESLEAEKEDALKKDNDNFNVLGEKEKEKEDEEAYNRTKNKIEVMAKAAGVELEGR